MIQVSVLVQCKRECCLLVLQLRRGQWCRAGLHHTCVERHVGSVASCGWCRVSVQRRESVGPSLRPLTLGSVFFLMYVIVWRSDLFCVFVVLPSLPPFWLDFELLSICLLVLLYFGCYVMCEKKKKNVDNKKKKGRGLSPHPPSARAWLADRGFQWVVLNLSLISKDLCSVWSVWDLVIMWTGFTLHWRSH